MLDFRPGINGKGFAIWFLWSSKLQLSIPRKWHDLLTQSTSRLGSFQKFYLWTIVSHIHNPFILNVYSFAAWSFCYTKNFQTCTLSELLQKLLLWEKMRKNFDENFLIRQARTAPKAQLNRISELAVFHADRGRPCTGISPDRKALVEVWKLLSHSLSGTAPKYRKFHGIKRIAIWYMCALNVFLLISIERASWGSELPLYSWGNENKLWNKVLT